MSQTFKHLLIEFKIKFFNEKLIRACVQINNSPNSARIYSLFYPMFFSFFSSKVG